MTIVTGRIFGILLLVLLGACRPGDQSARSAAERFLDQHYVRIDLDAARDECIGLARKKIEEEQRLIGDQVIDEATRKPRITYELREQDQEGEDRVNFVYDARIDVDGAGTFTRRWLITARRVDERWKVSNFVEFE